MALKALFYPDVSFDSLFIPYIYKEIYLDGVYVDVLNNRKDMVIMDVGANIGVTVQHFKDYAKKVYALEPSTEHFEALQKNCTFNEWKNVLPYKIALADKDGEMKLNLNNANRTCHSLTNDYGQSGELVTTKTFATFMKEHDIETVDFCKFDTEGAEDMILRSEGFTSVADRVKAIEVEFHYNTWPQLTDFMVSLGYQARRYPCSAIVILFTR